MKSTTHRAASFVTIRAFALSAAICVLSPFVIASAETEDVQTSCEPGKYPEDGNFEIAEITEQTSAITDLQKKQLSQRQPYAEAGTIIVVWRKSGQYACVRSPTGIPDIDFWVDQKFLRPIPETINGKDPWVGSYGEPPIIEIKSAGAGRYDVYAKYQHTIEDGPGWSTSISNEISAYKVKPSGNAIHVTLRRDITVSGRKAPIDKTSPGFIDDRCKPVMFVENPVLLVKDIGDCGDGSAFEGYWLRH